MQTRPSAVSVVGLRKSFGEKTVLDGIDLEVAEGDDLCVARPQRRRQDNHCPHPLEGERAESKPTVVRLCPGRSRASRTREAALSLRPPGKRASASRQTRRSVVVQGRSAGNAGGTVPYPAEAGVCPGAPALGR